MKKFLILPILLLASACNSSTLDTVIANITKGLTLAETLYSAIGSPGLPTQDKNLLISYENQVTNLFDQTSQILSNGESGVLKATAIFNLASTIAKPILQTTDPAITQEVTDLQIIVNGIVSTYATSASTTPKFLGIPTGPVTKSFKMSDKQLTKLGLIRARSEALKQKLKSVN